ncbi:hypothetical protein LINGRAHAP2_LOCUS14096 [Linum grandiflorum]
MVMVVLAAIIVTTASGKWSWPSEETMHISNELSMKLIVHCGSGNDDLKAQIVPVKSEYSWKFTGYGITLFWCRVAVQDKRADFVAFDGRGYCPFHWVVNDTGVYANEPGCYPDHIPWPSF